MKIRTLLAPVVIAGGLLAAAFGVAGNANASTDACLHGAFGSYCHDLADQSSTTLSLNVFRQGAAINQPVIGYYNSFGDKANDLLVFNRYGTGNGVFIEYAPNGVPSGLALSEPFNHAGVVLRVVNGGPWQGFQEVAVVSVTLNSKVVGYAPSGTIAADLPTADTGATLGTEKNLVILVNVKTGDILTTNGLRKQITGVTDPTTPAASSSVLTGLYTAAEVFS